MTTLLIRKCTLVDPSQGIHDVCDILIKDGKIEKIAANITEKVDRAIHAEGLYVFPGLVDMHVHFRDPGFTTKEDIITGGNAAVAGGITSVLCMPNTSPVVDNVDTIRYIESRGKASPVNVYICGAITKNLLGGELSDFSMYKKSGVIAVSDDGRPVENSEMMKVALVEAQKYGLVVTSHCEDLSVVSGGIINKGAISEKLNVKGIDRLSEDSVTEREIKLAEKTGTHIHIAHVSTKGSVELIRQAKSRGVDVSCETCPHYFVFTEEKLLMRDADYRMNPPLREQDDVDAIIEGIKDGTIDCITTDHAPHTKMDKQDFLKAPNGVVGLETSLAAGIEYLVKPGHISIDKLIELMSVNPAKELSIDAGTLKKGSKADLIIVDINSPWTVLPERLNSKSHNTAFKFTKITGKVKYTIINGRIVYVTH